MRCLVFDNRIFNYNIMPLGKQNPLEDICLVTKFPRMFYVETGKLFVIEDVNFEDLLIGVRQLESSFSHMGTI